ncbi:MAG TPA: hypothetical protein VME18_12120 [Acidobacteriaceae bacterium]|nr:hypothetical protein [Acidobacteriaceae bacterium]
MYSLLENFIMPDETPSGDKAVYVFIEMIALGFVLYAIEEAFKDHPSWVKVLVAFALGLVFFLLGVYWTRIKSTLGAHLIARLDRITNDYRYRYGAAVLVIGIAAFYVLDSLHGLRHDLNAYAMPRVVSSGQAESLGSYLSHHEPYSVTVKVDPSNQEATEYAAELLNAVKAGGWDVTFDTSAADTPPNTLNPGLCIGVVGQNAGPPDPKHDPAQSLQAALQSAHIQVNCGSGIGAGQYRLYLLVGPRPRVIGDQEPILRKFGRWIEHLSN